MAATAYKFPARAQSLLGVLLPGASLAFYAAGTLNPQSVFSDPELTIRLPNPMRADSAARFPEFYPDPDLSYRAILTSDAGEEWDLDPVSIFPGTDGATPLDDAGAPMPLATLTFWLSSTTELAPIYVDNTLTTQLANPLTADASGAFATIYLDDTIAYRHKLEHGDARLVYDYDHRVSIAGGGSGGGDGSDPFFADVVLLLHGNGSILDSSSYHRPTFSVDGAAASAVQLKFGLGSISVVDDSVAPAHQAVTWDAAPELNFTSIPHWTVEFWTRPCDAPDVGIDYAVGNVGLRAVGTTIGKAFDIGITYGTLLDDIPYGFVQVNGSTAGGGIAYSFELYVPFTPNTWHHIALVRNIDEVTLYINGVSQGTSILGEDLFDDATSWSLAGGAGARPHYIDDVRITTDSRYTADFVPPVTEFPDE